MKIFKNHKKHLLVGILSSVTIILLFSIAYAARINVDNFDDGPQDRLISTPSSFCDQATGAGVQGTQRDLYLEKINNGNAGNVRGNVDLGGNNVYQFSVEASVIGIAMIQWDGTDADCALDFTPGLGGLDFTDGGANDGYEVDVISADLNIELRVIVYTSATAASEATAVANQAVSAPGYSIFLPFSSFSQSSEAGITSPVTWTDVNAVEIRINEAQTPSVDVSLDLTQAAPIRDFGDLPSPTYNLVTTLANGGARHQVGSIFLGNDADTEADAQQDASATGDNVGTPRDDETQATGGGGVAPVLGDAWGDGSGQISWSTTLNGAITACVVGWVDWDGDGIFEDSTTGLGGVSEEVLNINTFFLGSPSGISTITTPTLADFGGSFPPFLYARFRVYERNDPALVAIGGLDGLGCPTSASDTVLLALVSGDATNGEVEDYRWQFDVPTAVTLQDISTSNGNVTPSALVSVGLALIGLTGAAVIIRRRTTQP